MHLFNILDHAHAEILGLSGLLSEEDMRDIHNLDKGENDLLAMVGAIDARATGIKTEAVQAGIGKLPPYRARLIENGPMNNQWHDFRW